MRGVARSAGLVLGLLSLTTPLVLTAQSGNSPDVSQNMAAGDAAIGAGDFRAAIVEYKKALALDSTNYDATVREGDAYLKLKVVDTAYLLYAKATRIDPDQPAAWRSWSDALLKRNFMIASGDKALEALIADPYNNDVRKALAMWAAAAKKSVAFPKVNVPVRDTSAVHSAAWVAYDSVRRVWRGADGRGGDVFWKEYPKDAAYHHSLAEEKAALQAAYKVADGDPATVNLKRMDDAGVLDAYILFIRPDAGIAPEYPKYRAEHRDALKKLWTDFIIGVP